MPNKYAPPQVSPKTQVEGSGATCPPSAVAASDTPRSDAYMREHGWESLCGKRQDYPHLSKFVRQIERELAAMRQVADSYALAAKPSHGPNDRQISGVKLVKMFKDQRDEVADVLRRIMAKLREESGEPDDPMYPFSFDASWEALAIEADAILAKCPSYTQQLENICDGLGITREQLEASLRATRNGGRR